MTVGNLETAALIVTGGAVAFALAVALASHQITAGVRKARARWRARAEELEWKVDRSDAIFAAYPGVILVWEDDRAEAAEESEREGDTPAVATAPKAATDWGKPLLYGSAPALAAMLRHAEASDGPDAGSRILDGIADFDAVDVSSGASTSLRRRLEALRAQGEAFTIVIDAPQGRRIEADGRPAGRRAVLWLADATLRSIEAASSREGVREGQAGADPVALVDLLGKAPFPVFRLSSGLKLQWANGTYLGVVGAKSLADAVQRDLQLDDRMKDQARRALAHGAPAHELRAVVTKGERRWHAVTVFPISGGVAAVAIDLTREQEAREAIERHVRAQGEALNHVRDAVATFGPDQELTFHNRAFRTLFKLDESYLNQRPFHGEILDRLRSARLIPDQANYQAWRASELARYSSGSDEPSEEILALPDGRMLRQTRLKHPLGGMILVFGDMTREVALETEFNTLIKVQRATLDKLNEGVAVFSPDGRLRLHNAAFETMWDIPAGALGEAELFDQVVERCMPLFADREEWAEIKARVTDVSPESRRAVAREIRRSDDTTLTYLQRPLPDGSTVIAFHDVTAARQLEAALKDRTDALAAAERVKTRFVENVSYHLRTPLTSVMGFAQLLNVTTRQKLDSSEASQLDAILQASEDLDKLVENIIVIAAIDADKLTLDLGDIEVRAVLEESLTLVKQSEGETRARLSVTCPREVGQIRADRLKIKQALYNLVINSLDHTAPGGRIEIGAERIGSSGVRVWVEDDGEGIPLDKQGKVFEAFETDGRRGAGLGLTLVRKFVEMHGGWLDIESTPDVGTRVTMHLPINPAKRAVAKPPPSRSAKER
jgi:signal transduction histidine kinase